MMLTATTSVPASKPTCTRIRAIISTPTHHLIPSRAQSTPARRVRCAYQPDASEAQRSVQGGAMPIATVDPSVEEVMVPHPVTLTPDMSCKEAARVLLDNDVSGAPVVDSSGKLLGVLSESDLLWKGVGAPLDHTIIPPVYIGAFDLLFSLRDNVQVQHEVDKILARTVQQAMTSSPLVTVKASSTMADAAQLMLAHKVNRLPVVDAANKVVGVITRHDVLRGMVASHSPLL